MAYQQDVMEQGKLQSLILFCLEFGLQGILNANEIAKGLIPFRPEKR
jgi:hypothetical protein